MEHPRKNFQMTSDYTCLTYSTDNQLKTRILEMPTHVYVVAEFYLETKEGYATRSRSCKL